MRTVLALTLLVEGVACAGGPPPPADLDSRHEPCAFCRMAVSNPRFAAQVAVPGELPRFFDDLGCLAGWLREHPGLPAGTVAYVADHRTEAWVRADRAVYMKVPGLETPMSSHVIAHADVASGARDADARDGTPIAPTELFGPSGPPTGGPRDPRAASPPAHSSRQGAVVSPAPPGTRRRT